MTNAEHSKLGTLYNYATKLMICNQANIKHIRAILNSNETDFTTTKLRKDYGINIGQRGLVLQRTKEPIEIEVSLPYNPRRMTYIPDNLRQYYKHGKLLTEKYYADGSPKMKISTVRYYYTKTTVLNYLWYVHNDIANQVLTRLKDAHTRLVSIQQTYNILLATKHQLADI